ncbi:MAG: glycoside hydrolase family 38 N-terminal domain-containing protein [Armatimonadota bacterium]
MSDNKAIMHILSHTHWDREWYQEFQGFRQRLVFQLDALIDLMEKGPEYKYFHMDGQTSCIADYLEIRPENKDRLSALIKAGRILIGPWFVMPDEMLLSGESLARNLLAGRKNCSSYGVQPMPIGYVTDIFGHCSQFPQILMNFDIDATILQRGTSGEDGATELVWEGADKSTVLLVKCFQYGSYGDFFMMHDKSDEEILEYEERKHSLGTTDVLFGMDGSDHAPAKWNLPELLDKFNGVFRKTTCKHSSMIDYLHDVKEALGDNWEQKHRRYIGELRLPNKKNIWGEMFQGTASSRVYLKQANDSLEYLLPRCAEALHVWSKLLGGDDQKSFLNLAWNYLLLNHPHDSIVGCSVDKVHRDMMYRFSEASSIAWNSIWESVQAITSKVDTASLGEGSALTAFNMAKTDTDKISDIYFEIPQGVINEKRSQGFAPVLFDSDNRPIAMNITASESSVWNMPIAIKSYGETPKFWTRDDLGEIQRIYAKAALQVSSSGYNSFRIGYMPAKDAELISLPEGYIPVKSTDNSIENEYVVMKSNPDGRVDLFDKVTGVSYAGLNEIEDCGDVGHGWDHIYPKTETVIRSVDSKNRGPVSVSVKQNGLLSASITVSYSLKVPKGVTADRTKRSKEKISVKVSTEYTLDSGSKRVNCKTVIDNKALNHRMRSLFPTGRNCSTWFGDTAFDLVERDIKLLDTTGWLEPKREESMIKNIAAACDENAGLAVITKGLCEACVQDNVSRSIALTLFRGFSQSVGSHWTTDSQMQGEVSVEYAILPFASDNNRPPVSIFDDVEHFKMPIICYTGQVHDGELPVSGQLVNISGNVVLSTIKTSEDGKSNLIRLFNPDVTDVETVLTYSHSLNAAWLCNMAEEETESLALNGRSLTAKIPAKKVISIKYI